ncbi:hypothetical protein ACTQ2R_04925 [Hallella faecis]|uniref:hypothetical protein n=1 Tax=Hallella faecis TaxID=2841596 RepID=UPI003F935A57
MDQGFDFKQVGKRMPYSAPDGLFREMEMNVMNMLKDERMDLPQKPIRKKATQLWITAVAVAASVTALWIVNPNLSTTQSNNGIEAVDQAFTNLSQDDQDYLLDVYQADVFINN